MMDEHILASIPFNNIYRQALLILLQSIPSAPEYILPLPHRFDHRVIHSPMAAGVVAAPILKLWPA